MVITQAAKEKRSIDSEGNMLKALRSHKREAKDKAASACKKLDCEFVVLVESNHTNSGLYDWIPQAYDFARSRKA